MHFATDDHFLIGSMHYREGKPCQDHALSKAQETVAVAVVSDGCSGGGHTDIGARIMSLTLMETLVSLGERGVPFGAFDVAEAQASALETLKGIHLSRDDLLATCSYLFLSIEGGFAHVRGDGVVAIREVDGSITLHRFDWNGNKPFYPIYLREDGARGFAAAHGGFEAPALTQEVWRHTPQGGYEQQQTLTHTVREGIQGITIPILATTFAFAVVFSDGVTQVDGVDWKDAVHDLLAFKTTVGSFAKRRLMRFVEQARKQGQGPLDDIAYAVVHAVREGREV